MLSRIPSSKHSKHERTRAPTYHAHLRTPHPNQIRLLEKDGTQLEKRSTTAVGPVAASSAISMIPIASISTKSIPASGKNVRDKDKEADATGRNPCWVGLDNGELCKRAGSREGRWE